MIFDSVKEKSVLYQSSLLEMMIFNSVFRDGLTRVLVLSKRSIIPCFSVSFQTFSRNQNVTITTTFMKYLTWNPGFMREKRENRSLANPRYLPLFLNLFM